MTVVAACNKFCLGAAKHLLVTRTHGFVKGGASSAVCAQCARSATIWVSSRTRDPYFEILGAPRGIMVTPSGGFDF